MFQIVGSKSAAKMTLERSREFWPKAEIVGEEITAPEMPVARCLACGLWDPPAAVLPGLEAAHIAELRARVKGRKVKPVPRSSEDPKRHHIGGWAKRILGG